MLLVGSRRTWEVHIYGTGVEVVGAAIVTIEGRATRTITTNTQKMRRHLPQLAHMMAEESIQVTVVIADGVVRSSNDQSDQSRLLCLLTMNGIKAKPARYTVRLLIPQDPIRADIATTARALFRETSLYDIREATNLPQARSWRTITSRDMMIPRRGGTRLMISPSRRLPLQLPTAWECRSVRPVVLYSLRM